MQVRFTKLTPHTYAVWGEWPDEQRARVPGIAAGNDAWLPHELAHFAVEDELGLRLGVFGRMAATRLDVRNDRQRTARKLKRRTEVLKGVGHDDMGVSERLASVCDVLWRLRAGLLPERPAWLPKDHSLSPEQERIVARMAALAEQWHALPVGGSLVLPWRHAARVHAAAARARS